MVEFILGMTLLNSVLILYFHYQQQEVNKEILETVKGHHFYYGRPDEDWFIFDFIEAKIQKIMNIIEVKDLKKAYLKF